MFGVKVNNDHSSLLRDVDKRKVRYVDLKIDLSPSVIEMLSQWGCVQVLRVSSISGGSLEYTPSSPNPDWKEKFVPFWDVISTGRNPKNPLWGNLCALNLESSGITDKGLSHLERLRNLTFLKLMGNNVTNEGLCYLRGLTNLTSLNLARTEITDEGLSCLRELKKLTSLNLSETKKIVGDGLPHLKGLQNLASLDLSSSGIISENLRYLKGHTNLKWLNLGGTRIYDKDLVHLKELSSLVEVDVRETSITLTGARDLFDALPNLLKVRHSDFTLPWNHLETDE